MRFFRYEIPLHPSPIACSYRRGLILQRGDRWAEIAPLPGFSQETLEEALQDLHTRHLPSVQFGFASLQIPFPTHFPPIAVSALASHVTDILHALEQGVHTIKLKASTPEHTLEVLSSIPKHSPLRVRIDVNRKWTLPETRSFLKKIDLNTLEYLEEPLTNPYELPSLETVPIALDETLLQPDAETFCQLPNVTALVLKPTLLGDKLKRFLSLPKKLVFSSSFESPIGLMHLAQLQHQYAPTHAAGLDTARFFHTLEPAWFREISL